MRRLRGGRACAAGAPGGGPLLRRMGWQHRAAQSSEAPGSELTQGVLGGEFPEPSNRQFWLVEDRGATDGYECKLL